MYFFVLLIKLSTKELTQTSPLMKATQVNKSWAIVGVLTVLPVIGLAGKKIFAKKLTSS